MTSGVVFNLGAEMLGVSSGSYYWGAYYGQLNLGVLPGGESASIDCKLTSLACSTASNCIASGNGGGDMPCYNQAALAPIGDALDGNYDSLPGAFDIESQPAGPQVAVPEPATTAALLGVGLAGLAFVRRRRTIA